LTGANVHALIAKDTDMRGAVTKGTRETNRDLFFAENWQPPPLNPKPL
jgi:hypothetical protein